MKSTFLHLGLAGTLFLTGCAQKTGTVTEAPPPATSSSQASDNSESDAKPEMAASPSTAEPASEEVKAKAQEVLATLKDGRFPNKEKSTKANGPAFVHLASESTDSVVVGQALEGMKKTFRVDQESDRMNKTTEAYNQAVLKHLSSEDSAVLYHALGASTKSLGKEPHQAVLAKLADLAANHKELGARVEALNALYYAEGYADSPELLKVFIDALDDEPAVASTALFRSDYKWLKAKNAADIEAKITSLLTHADPGVRGRAIDFLGSNNSSKGDEYLVSTAAPLLDDPHPFVRSSACKALSRAKSPAAVHKMMAKIDDKEKNTYDINYTNLLGKPDYVHHDGSAWSRVDDAVLYNVKSATYSLGEGKRFEYGQIDYKDVDGSIAAEVAKAKSWYETYKSENP